MSDATPWWANFFDGDYLELWSPIHSAAVSERQAETLWNLLGLSEGCRLLDAPVGYGRVAVPLARRGARVTGVDFSADMIAAAARARDAAGLSDSIELIRADLREPLPRARFDAAIDLFSSVGYGSEADDLAIFRSIGGSLVEGGRLFLETHHRDFLVARQSRNARPASRLEDGTLLIEERTFDPIRGVIETTWFWSGPRGSGQKSATLRVYAATELVAMLEVAGFALRGAYKGVSEVGFDGIGPDGGGRLGLLLESG